MKKLIMFLVFVVCVLPLSVFALDYKQVQGDALMVYGVQWQKQASATDYIALVTLDLNYKDYMNPQRNGLIVEEYIFNNWWWSGIDFGDNLQGRYGINIFDEEYLTLNLYKSIPCVDNDPCDTPDVEIAYFGLPFYISKLEFMCDINDASKGGKNFNIDTTGQLIQLIRPNYDGLPQNSLTIETTNIPLGFVTNQDERIRFNQQPISCNNMNSTQNAVLRFVLKPNNYYRHLDPNIEGSETWEYDDIIASLPSISNNENLPFKLDIEFDFSGNFWDTTLTNEEFDEWIDNFGGDDFKDMDCNVELSSRLGDTGVEKLKFSELTHEQQVNINTGKIVVIEPGNSWRGFLENQGIILQGGTLNTVSWCQYAPSETVKTINSESGFGGEEDWLEQLSIQNQRTNAIALDNLNKKLETKKFFARTIVPSMAIVVILLFYMFQVVVLGVTIFGILPLMFTQFTKGLREAFDISDLIKGDKKKLPKRFKK